MKAKIFKGLKLGGIVLSIFNLMMFFSMRCCWSGISKTLKYEKSESLLILHLPEILCVIFLLVAATNITLYFVMKKEKNLWTIILNVFNFIFFIALMVIIKLGALDYMRFVWQEFLTFSIVLLIVLSLLFLIFVYPKTKLKDSKVFKFVLLGCIVLTSLGYLTSFSINYITYEPVVYAVNDTYQIIFSSSTTSLGWVEVGGEPYYDLNAGSQKSETKVHKIEIPMSKLDDAKSYTIKCQNMIYRGPFGGLKGRIIDKTYNFRPVDSSDGLNYYALADVHMGLKESAKAAKYMENMEFLVLAGDIISVVDTYIDANYTNKVAFEITKGEIPVVYARGNHEIKGKYSEELHKFVGSVNGDFYYNFYFDNVYGMVLDIGEDHDDDYWEYYETAKYDLYRQEQIDYMNNELATENYKNFDYRMIVSHIPIVYVNSRKNHEYVKTELTKILNQMDIDIALSGHQHDLLVFEPYILPANKKLPYNSSYSSGTFKGYVTDFNFPNFLISKRGYTQTDDSDLVKVKSQIGLGVSVDFVNQQEVVIYNNSLLEKVNIVNPFKANGEENGTEIDYGTEIVIDLITKKFN